MIYDVFPFFNELDLLEIRFHELDPVVDKFILCEATTTHSGKPKPLYFEENKHLFATFRNKLVHCIIDLPQTDDPWVRENAQRDYLQKELINQGAQPDDIVISSDADEIVKKRTLVKMLPEIGEPTRTEMMAYEFFVTCYSGLWRNPFISRYGAIKNTLSNLRKLGGVAQDRFFPDFGWHLSYMGGVNKVFHKLDSYAHQEYNNDDNKQQAATWVAKKNRPHPTELPFLPSCWFYPGATCDSSDLPRYLLDNRDKFSYLFG
jgi:hypothetical protein